MGYRTKLTRRTIWIATLLAFVGLTGIHFVIPKQLDAPTVKYITVSAYQWGFDPPVIRVNRGDTLVMRIRSLDAVHGLSIDGYDVFESAIVPGDDRIIRIHASNHGTFKVRCNSICGPLHPFMLGELVVEPDLPSTYGLVITVLLAIVLALLLQRRDGG